MVWCCPNSVAGVEVPNRRRVVAGDRRVPLTLRNRRRGGLENIQFPTATKRLYLKEATQLSWRSTHPAALPENANITSLLILYSQYLLLIVSDPCHCHFHDCPEGVSIVSTN